MGRRLSNRKSVKKKKKKETKPLAACDKLVLAQFFFFFASQATNTCSTKRSFLSQWHEPMMRTQKNKLPLLYNHQARCVNELKRACGKEKKKMLSLPDPDEKAGNNEKDATLGSKESAGKGNHGTETLGRQKARRRQHSRSHAKLCS